MKPTHSGPVPLWSLQFALLALTCLPLACSPTRPSPIPPTVGTTPAVAAAVAQAATRSGWSPLPPFPNPAVAVRIRTVSWTLADSIVVSEEGKSGCSARSLNPAGLVGWERPLPFCPERSVAVPGGLVLFQAPSRSLLMAGDGTVLPGTSEIAAAASQSLFLLRSRGLLEAAEAGIRIADRGVGSSSIADRSGHPIVVVAQEDEKGAETLVREPDHKVLTPPFAIIDSFDLSSDGREVVFSARREPGGFDVGLVSTDGGAIHWLPNDPADEVDVRWAPVGYKVGYLIRRADGDLFRSIHIPTSVQQAIDFPMAKAGPWSWSPDGTRIAVVTSSPDQADHVDVISNDGIVRRPLISAQSHTELNLETLEGYRGTIVSRPALMKYNETLPLVVWSGEPEPLVWDDARGELAKAVRIASVVTSRPAADLGPDFWQRIKSLPWIDSSRVYVVGAGPRPAALPPQAILIASVPGESGGSGYREVRSGGAETVLLTSRSSAVVKSFAATYIANRLKGISIPP